MIPAWISNYVQHKVWDEITYPFPNFNVEVWELSNFITPFPGTKLPLRWRHNGRDGVSNHQPHDCLHSRVFRRRSKAMLHQSSASQKVSNAENVSIQWCHRVNHTGIKVTPRQQRALGTNAKKYDLPPTHLADVFKVWLYWRCIL